MVEQNYTILIINPAYDTIDLMHLKAKDKVEARQLLEPNLKLHETPLILTERQLRILMAKLDALKED